MAEFTEKILNGQTFLINLDVATDRLETALKNIANAGFTCVERVSGVHASEISAEDLAAEWTRHGSPKFCQDEIKGGKFQAQIGRQGCMLSHLNIWKKIIESDGPDGELFTVFEDDVIFHSQWKTLAPCYYFKTPRDFDILYIGNQISLELLSRKYVLRVPTYCNHAYIITRHGAKKIYSWLLSQHSGVHTIDEMMHDHMISNEKHSFDWYCWNVTSLFKCSNIITLPSSYTQRSTGIVFQNPHYESFIGEYEVESKYISIWRNMTLIDKKGTQLLRKTPPNIMNELLVLENDRPIPDILIPDGEEYIYDSIESLPKLELDPNGLYILFYSKEWQSNFHHLLVETIPILYIFDVLKNTDVMYKLLIPESSYTILVKNLVTLYGISDSKIFILPSNTACKVNNLFKINELSTVSINKLLINTFVKLRNKLHIKANITPSRYIYLCRSNTSSVELNNCSAGKKRTILNQNDLNNMLKRYNFEFIDNTSNDLQEKYEKLKNAKIIITESGANVLNILFTNIPKHLILLCNNYTEIDWNMYWETLIRNVSGANFTCLKYRSSSDVIDYNEPFTVDIDTIEKNIIEHL